MTQCPPLPCARAPALLHRSRGAMAMPSHCLSCKRPSSCTRLAVTKRDLLYLGGGVLLNAGAASASEQQEAAAADGASTAAPPAAPRRRARRRPPPPPQPPPPPVPRVLLAPGVEVSAIMRGTRQLDGRNRGDAVTDRTSGAAAVDDLQRYVDAGFTTLATDDGPAESTVGRLLRLRPELAPPATQAVVTLNLMMTGGELLSASQLEYRVRAALVRLGVRRADVLQMHWQNWHAPGHVDAARALLKLQDDGLIAAFGVSNYDTARLIEFADAGIKPVCNMVTYSALDRRPAALLAPCCAKHGVALLAASPLAGGLLSDRYVGVPASKVRLDTAAKAQSGGLITQLGGWAWFQDLLHALRRIGRKHGGYSVSATALRWVLQQEGVAAAAIGARNAMHVRDTRRAFGWALDEADLLDLDAVYEGAARVPTGDVGAWERGGVW